MGYVLCVGYLGVSGTSPRRISCAVVSVAVVVVMALVIDIASVDYGGVGD